MPEKSATANGFLDRAYPRMLLISGALAGIGTIAALLFFGVAPGAGFALGSAATIVNFMWLHRAVEALVERMLRSGKRISRLRIVLGFLGRYGLVAILAYAIFKSSARAFAAFLTALPLPILAAMCEAIYEALLNIKDADSANS